MTNENELLLGNGLKYASHDYSISDFTVSDDTAFVSFWFCSDILMLNLMDMSERGWLVRNESDLYVHSNIRGDKIDTVKAIHFEGGRLFIGLLKKQLFVVSSLETME